MSKKAKSKLKKCQMTTFEPPVQIILPSLVSQYKWFQIG